MTLSHSESRIASNVSRVARKHATTDLGSDEAISLAFQL
jgi:hypothetical protein